MSHTIDESFPIFFISLKHLLLFNSFSNVNVFLYIMCDRPPPTPGTKHSRPSPRSKTKRNTFLCRNLVPNFEEGLFYELALKALEEPIYHWIWERAIASSGQRSTALVPHSLQFNAEREREKERKK